MSDPRPRLLRRSATPAGRSCCWPCLRRPGPLGRSTRARQPRRGDVSPPWPSNTRSSPGRDRGRCPGRAEPAALRPNDKARGLLRASLPPLQRARREIGRTAFQLQLAGLAAVSPAPSGLSGGAPGGPDCSAYRPCSASSPSGCAAGEPSRRARLIRGSRLHRERSMDMGDSRLPALLLVRRPFSSAPPAWLWPPPPGRDSRRPHPRPLHRAALGRARDLSRRRPGRPRDHGWEAALVNPGRGARHDRRMGGLARPGPCSGMPTPTPVPPTYPRRAGRTDLRPVPSTSPSIPRSRWKACARPPGASLHAGFHRQRRRLRAGLGGVILLEDDHYRTR